MITTTISYRENQARPGPETINSKAMALTQRLSKITNIWMMQDGLSDKAAMKPRWVTEFVDITGQVARVVCALARLPTTVKPMFRRRNVVEKDYLQRNNYFEQSVRVSLSLVPSRTCAVDRTLKIELLSHPLNTHACKQTHTHTHTLSLSLSLSLSHTHTHTHTHSHTHTLSVSLTTLHVSKSAKSNLQEE